MYTAAKPVTDWAIYFICCENTHKQTRRERERDNKKKHVRKKENKKNKIKIGGEKGGSRPNERPTGNCSVGALIFDCCQILFHCCTDGMERCLRRTLYSSAVRVYLKVALFVSFSSFGSNGPTPLIMQIVARPISTGLRNKKKERKKENVMSVGL